MKKYIFLSLWTIFICLLSVATFCNQPDAPPEKEYVFITSEKVDDWDKFIEAIIIVESNGNDTIVNSKNAGGALQITPIYIAEANNIIGKQGYYKIEDRFNRAKAIEIFKVVNGYHNIEKDFEKALKIHNPNAGNWYKNRVYNVYKKIQNGKDI